MTPSGDQSVADHPPTLIVVAEGRLYLLDAADAPFTVGRQWPAQIVINHPGISTRHLRISPADDGSWHATDHSTNGSFLDGTRQHEFAVTDGLTIHLGSADDGIAVSFSLGMPQTADGELKPGTTTFTTTSDPDDADSVTTAAIAPPILAHAVGVALSTIDANLQQVADADFHQWAQGTLPELRRLEALSASTAQSAPGTPELTMTLSRVRRLYRQVMLRAAGAQGATAGQRLFQARHEAQITVDEAANAVRVAPETIEAAESDQPLAPEDAAAIKRLQAWLTHL